MPTGDEHVQKQDLGTILEGLLRKKIDFILVGGLAAVVQGAPLTTMDVDIVHDRSPENVKKLFAFLKSVGAIYRRLDDLKVEPKMEDIAGKGHLLLTTPWGALDVLAMIEEDKTYTDLLEHCVEIPFRGYRINVLGLEMLAMLKRTSNCPGDKQRLSVLEEALRQKNNR